MRKIECLKKFGEIETFRYLAGGGLTVTVNIFCYLVLAMYLAPLWANTWAFFVAVVFAYLVNGSFVFRTSISWKGFFAFMGMRMGTLVLDDGGMALLLACGWQDLMAKGTITLVIIVVNYLCSKFLIFR